MEKYTVQWSYRLGMVSLVLAVLTRGIDIVAPSMNVIPTNGDSIGYNAFVHGAMLCFGTTIATTCYVWFNAQEARLRQVESIEKRHAYTPEEILRELVQSSANTSESEL